MKSLILTISCSDKPGIVAEVTKFLFKNGFNILESGQFNDKYTDNFFMRTEFQLHDKKNLFDENSFDELKDKLEPVFGGKFPVAAVTNKGKQVVSDDSSAAVTLVAIDALVALVTVTPAI